VEYITRQNTTIGELAEEYGPASDKSSSVGFHSEVLIAQAIHSRPDILRSETKVSQVFTERFPCRECQGLLSSYPQFQNAPFYYYLSYTDKTWQKQRAGGSWGPFLLQRYGLPAEL
jgi:hypothetical protein